MQDTYFQQKLTLNCKGSLIVLEKPAVMGIINCTPDSFYDGGQNNTIESAINLAGRHLQEGASFLDIGGQSTRPGAQRISAAEELERVIPIIEAIHSSFPEAIISIDTTKAIVAEASVIAGASIINDISTGEDDLEILDVAKQYQTPFIMMHKKGDPENMQINPSYKNIVQEVLEYLTRKIEMLKLKGISDLIVDPGFGFGKTIDHNYSLLQSLQLFQSLQLPVLVGLSRKSMIYKTLNCSPDEALNGTSILHTISLLNGAKILRVHDSRAAMECIHLTNKTFPETLTR